MRLHPARPRGIPLLALTALALTTVGLAAPATAAPLAGTPVTADEVCTADPSTRPVGVYELTAVEDAGVGIWAGGGLTVTTATELEGRVVVGGDADLSGAGSLNVGTAGGGGSAITPAGGTDMLVVGGDLATATNTQVGFHASSGGNVVVGGAITGATPSTEGRNAPGRPGTVTQGVGREAALRPYAALPGLVTGLATDAADGAVAATPRDGVLTVEAGARYTLTAAQASTLTTLHVTGSGPVLLTVTGPSVDVSRLQHVEYGGVRVYQATQHLSAHFLWSFPDATQVTLGTNDQFPGTIVVPRTDATLTVATSTNGRILSNGAVSYTGGAGIEHHNYPFAGPCESTPFVEEPQPEPSPEGPNPGEGVTTPPTAEETPSPEEPGEPTVEATPAAETPAPGTGATPESAEQGDDTPGSGLASTGASVVVLAVVAALLLAGGATVLVVARRRATS
ncbi:choice-of-anchor A domain-containing protein [Cellulosimicrobium cellulans]|uniref:choice-of-anchor A family protein n=1 Tax=Cellulosimicrobium cellulans TaxID=1710 RepID=UPI00195D0F2D|nr:choice-of-anchor A family protein [Cellulosimicrobium cellulans]MBM7820058.1 choice-of-anchor A domain-containing protein [Cellulosimicrobium cellulans]